MESFTDILIKLAFAGICAIIVLLLKMHKDRIISVATQLIQEVEKVVQGSGLGEEKKTKVVAQLQAMGIHVSSWLSDRIDTIVTYLNDNSGWLISDATYKIVVSNQDQSSAK